MNYGPLLAKALMEFNKAATDYLKREHIEAAGDTIMACSVTAAIAGVGSGWIPGVGSMVATAVWVGAIWTMYVKINKDLGISIKENALKSLASAFLTNIIASAGSLMLALFFATVASFIPFWGSASAIAVDGFIGFVTVYSAGLLYIKVLTKLFLKNGNFDMSEADVAQLAKEVAADGEIDGTIKEARSAFKQARKNGEFKK